MKKETIKMMKRVGTVIAYCACLFIAGMSGYGFGKLLLKVFEE